MIPNPTQKGKRSEARILSDLVAAGKSVLVPWGEERFDLVVYEEDGSFRRIQVKTGCLKNGYVLFRTVSVCNSGRSRQIYRGQVDAFGVYCPELDQSYLVPAEGLPSEMASLRVAPTLNGQASGVRWARDFELTPKSMGGARVAPSGHLHREVIDGHLVAVAADEQAYPAG
jgi:hypothetical protein